jgi:DNA polymerase
MRASAPRVETTTKKSAAKRYSADQEWQPAPVPETSSLTKLRQAASTCTACPLHKNATQTVFGEGQKRASLMFLGEQPGDQEDLSGKPFVGPAGQLLNRALEEAGIDRDAVYVTNTVKHFKWKPRGKRRIHQRPSSRDIAACRPWLEAELQIVRPEVLVCLGSTAAQTIFGSGFRVTRERGKLLDSKLASRVVTTVHPSSLFRQPDEESRQREYKLFLNDLRVAKRAAKSV